MKLSPKDFFLSGAVFVTLYISAISLLTLLFQYINYLFPDVLNGVYGDPYSGTIRFSIAALVIIFPLYIFLTRVLNQDLRRNPEKRSGSLRKWLIYLTLFVAGATVAGDLIALINSFLSGDLTTRFVLKVGAILAVVGAGFWYYVLDLREYWVANEQRAKMVGASVVAVVVGSIIGGFVIIGSPQQARDSRFDAERVGDLQNIQWQIVNFWQQKERLPVSLSELEDPIVGFTVPTDPQTGTEYEYSLVDGTTFSLCSEFTTSVDDVKASRLSYELSYPGFESTSWSHDAGKECFERTIDPERFPPFTKS